MKFNLWAFGLGAVIVIHSSLAFGLPTKPGTNKVCKLHAHMKRFTDTANNQQLPKQFVPGIMATDSGRVAAPAFSPDGNTVYFGKAPIGGTITIVQSDFKQGKWSTPTPASFSTKYSTLEPALSPDGKFLIFASSRPETTDGLPLTGEWDGKTYPGKGGKLWKTVKTQKGWSDPILLPETINNMSAVFSPAISADGSLYYMRADSGEKFHIYRSQYKNGVYLTPVRQTFYISQYGDFDPVVAPDESFLIFSSSRPPAKPGHADLFIVFRKGDHWTDPLDLRTVLGEKVYGIEARLSPDRQTLYYTNSLNNENIQVPHQQFIWMVDISKFLRAHGIKK